MNIIIQKPQNIYLRNQRSKSEQTIESSRKTSDIAAPTKIFSHTFTRHTVLNKKGSYYRGSATDSPSEKGEDSGDPSDSNGDDNINVVVR